MLFNEPGLAILLIAIALGVRNWKPKLAIALMLVSVLSLYALSTPVVAEVLQQSLENSYPAIPIEAVEKADAIVVLGGYLHEPSSQHPIAEFTEAIDRLWAASRLFRAQKAPLVLLAGGTVPVLGQATIPESQAAKSVLEQWGVPPEAILVEVHSRNTHENAIFSAPILAGNGVHRSILVTSAAHMPRALAIFKRTGLDVVPFPTDYQSGWNVPELLIRWLPDAEALLKSNRAIKEWIGWAVYRLRGWA